MLTAHIKGNFWTVKNTGKYCHQNIYLQFSSLLQQNKNYNIHSYTYYSFLPSRLSSYYMITLSPLKTMLLSSDQCFYDNIPVCIPKKICATLKTNFHINLSICWKTVIKIISENIIVLNNTLLRSSWGAEEGPVCNYVPPNYDSWSLQGTHRRLKKTWVDIPDVGQKGEIQDGVEHPRWPSYHKINHNSSRKC